MGVLPLAPASATSPVKLPSKEELPRQREREFRRSFRLVQWLDFLRHSPNGNGKTLRPPLLWAGVLAFSLGLIGFIAYVLSPRIEALSGLLGSEGWNQFIWLGISFVLIVVGAVTAIANYPDGKYRSASERMERISWPLRWFWVVAMGLFFVVSAISSTVAAVAGPWDLLASDWLPIESVEDARWFLTGLMFVSSTLFLVAAMVVSSLATHPIATIRKGALKGLAPGIAWSSLLLGLSGALFLLAVVVGLVRIMTQPMPMASTATLGVALLSASVILAGRHSSELRRRHGQAVQLLEEIAAHLEPHVEWTRDSRLAYCATLNRLERESRVPQGSWWWFPHS